MKIFIFAFFANFAIFAALLCLGNLLGTKRRRNVRKLFDEALRTPAVFHCGAQLRRVDGDAENLMAVGRDGIGPQVVAHDEYFIRCPDACPKRATCPRIKALADRRGKLTPVSLALAHVHQAYLVDDDLTVRDILDPNSKVEVALVRAATFDADIKPPPIVSDPDNGAACISEKLEGIVY